MSDPFIHESAFVESGAELGNDVKVWHQAQIRSGARIGSGSIIGKNVFVDAGVVVGRACKIQNNALVYKGAQLGDGVFVGPGVIITNDLYPRAMTPSGEIKTGDDWEVGRVVVETGASLGAGAVVVTGVRVGEWAVVGAGAVVTRDVDPHTLVLGVPASAVASVCFCGRTTDGTCEKCGWSPA
jgi:acetyltransferase-like isoleucine patch superfamily enzyme